MGFDIHLRRPTFLDSHEIQRFKQEFLDNGEHSIPGGGQLLEFKYNEWLRRVRKNEKKKLDESNTPSSLYLSVNNSSREIVGVVQIRHFLVEKNKVCGGHIGFSVRPAERLKGYAVQQLMLALKKASEHGIKDALLTCDKTNVGSRAVILANGGVFESEIYCFKNKVPVERYWIETRSVNRSHGCY